MTVNLADLLFSVSEAMDLSDSTLVDHQLRTAFVSSEIARAAQLDYELVERLFIAALLHDIGALSPEEKVSAHVFEDSCPEPHCQRGARLFLEAFWLRPSAPIVGWHHTPMAVHRDAGRSLSDPDVLGAQIVFLADHLERAIQRDSFILDQAPMLRRCMRDLAGANVHHDVVALFEAVAVREDFWLALVSKNIDRQMRERNLLRSIDNDYETARSVASVLKDMTDFRSRFTATHSSGVAACARGIGEVLNFSGAELQQLDIAGLLHDVGKLVVPNTILCKPTSLDAHEYAVIQQHPFYTYQILSRVRGFEQIAAWAGFHHERLDGSGYCNHLKRHDLDLGAKIVAIADIATAIAEPRPYRGGSAQKTVLTELRTMAANGQLERQIVEALADCYDPIMTRTIDAQAESAVRYAECYATIV
ncbi:MAG: HD domain-containing protein [Azospirillaceae bacterium]|nr:HD domain-containing protein [Azospirillaceae bacterium]